VQLFELMLLYGRKRLGRNRSLSNVLALISARDLLAPLMGGDHHSTLQSSLNLPP
jgi:hypothetical protein